MGGSDTDTYIYQPNAACADCHRYTRSYNATLKLDGITGHDFKIEFNVCLKCHEGFPNAEEAESFVRNQQISIKQHYNETIIKVKDAGNLSKTIPGEDRSIYMKVYNESLFNMQFVETDKSWGAHNPKYAEELVHKAELKADNILKGDPEAAAKIPGFDLLSAIMSLLFVVPVIAMKQRK